MIKPLTQQISITPEERKQLRELAYTLELSMSAIIRAAVDEYYQRLTADTTPQEATDETAE